ncbi:MAG: formate dehydrogenase accessory sulfurtransferase FdhD [Ilumatobacteraceae bacterium]
MARRRVERVLTTRVTGTGAERTEQRFPDRLIVEEPMSIRLDGTLVSTTMRTPGNDFELAVGFCFTEGLLADAPVAGVKYCADLTPADRLDPNDYNTVTVETGGRAPEPTPRLGNVSSSCVWCGSDQLDEMCARLDPLPAQPPIDLDVLMSVPDRVAAEQSLFAETGAVHGAAAFDRNGNVSLVREDVGRHNAVDKVVGAMVLGSAVPATGTGLFVSGRASIEMVQKAWAAGFGTVLAMSAPTALAVDAANRAGKQLAGFVRAQGFNVYTGQQQGGSR